ncbi:MAG: glycosyltransferase [Anaerolineae bacterium]|nr:glycosyltransferase [Anaerolineae bacterium]
MRVLFLTAQLPEPPHAGGTLRTNGLMRGVHAAGHDVHLLSFDSPEKLSANRAALDTFCASAQSVPPPTRRIRQRLYDLLFSRLADMQRRYDSPLYAETLKHVLAAQPFDLIQIESLEMAVYLPLIKQLQPDARVIYDSFNAEYDLQRTIYETERNTLRRLPGALYSLIQWRRLTRFERQVCESVDHVIAVSEADAEAFQRLAPGCAVSVVPNGINTLPYAEGDSSLDLGDHALVFTGSMGYRPNVDAAIWFADQVLDKVRARVDDAKFFVVGSHPHRRLDVLREREDVEITGWVPDVNPFLHAAAVYVAPLRMGSGTRLKLLQAMAAGQAVVSTSMGAQGLHAQNGVELHIADTADDFAAIVASLLEDPAQRQTLGQAGADYIRANYDWSVIVPRLLQVYDTIFDASKGESYEQTATTPA